MLSSRNRYIYMERKRERERQTERAVRSPKCSSSAKIFLSVGVVFNL